MAKLNLFGLLREGIEGRNYIEVSGKTVSEVIEAAVKNYPELKNKLCDHQGQIRKYIRFYVNQEAVKPGEQETFAVAGDDLITVIIPLAGGTSKGEVIL